MIRQFFKEYSVWYLTYILLSILFIVIFALYRLPLAYFKVSILINFTISAFGNTLNLSRNYLFYIILFM